MGPCDVILERKRLYKPEELALLQGTIRARYSTTEELHLFEAVMKGATVAQALENLLRQDHQQQAVDGDVALF
jgi:hypothetical protein